MAGIRGSEAVRNCRLPLYFGQVSIQRCSNRVMSYPHRWLAKDSYVAGDSLTLAKQSENGLARLIDHADGYVALCESEHALSQDDAIGKELLYFSIG